MKAPDCEAPLQGAEEQASLATAIMRLRGKCEDCHPLTPITCVTTCSAWKLKNEFRRLYHILKRPSFMADLLNTLKNKRRTQILGMICLERNSPGRLQQELKKLGYNHSQETIIQEYLNPLTEVGLAENTQNQYHATTFGCKINELIKGFPDLADVLPPHSECYEEAALEMLLERPKTHQELNGGIQEKSVDRVLKRLQEAGLVETRPEKDYIFLFKTKRDPGKASFSPTEKRVYENILPYGISARQLAEKTEISLRRTYKYLRRLKGKKLIFTRERHASYTLTPKGLQIAKMLKGLQRLTTETLVVAKLLVEENSRPSVQGCRCNT
jgi:predicted transcriptional regulator